MSAVSAPVVVAAGGTGGHVVPALAVADVLRARDVPVVWLGTRVGLEARLVPAAGIDIRWIDVAGLRGQGLFGTLRAPLKLARACLQSVRLLHRLRPRAVLGMGGFVSGPVGLAALVLRRPLVLHEQNAVAGLTNRRLARFATRVLVAWPGAFADGARVTIVGNPVRRDIAALAADTAARIPDSAVGQAVGQAIGPAAGRGSDRSPADTAVRSHPAAAVATPLAVLVVGGSRGARALNETVPAAIALLAASGSAIAVRHQTGAAEADAVRARYAGVAATATVEPFIEDMAGAYRAADLVICRSGAMTVTELAALGVPSILVPYPHAVDDHQSANGRQLERAGGAVLMPQSTLTVDGLAAAIARLDADRAALAAMADAARSCFRPGAAEAVADALDGCNRADTDRCGSGRRRRGEVVR